MCTDWLIILHLLSRSAAKLLTCIHEVDSGQRMVQVVTDILVEHYARRGQSNDRQKLMIC